MLATRAATTTACTKFLPWSPWRKSGHGAFGRFGGSLGLVADTSQQQLEGPTFNTARRHHMLVVASSSPVPVFPHHQQQQLLLKQQQQLRFYTPFTKEEEEQEKARVSHLSPEEKDVELRQLNREIARLETLKGINTGELYTWTGRYKALTREYGFPLMVYYFGVWATTGMGLYLGLDVLGLDPMQVLDRVDQTFGWSLSDKVDPQLGKLGIVLVLNEMLEPLRLPFVIVTLKPVMDKIAPPKY